MNAGSPLWLLLFDIDGTLITTGGAGERALRTAFTETFGIEDDLKTIEIAGRTDTGIVRQLFSRHGIELSADKSAQFLGCYTGHLARLLPELDGRLLPGVTTLLDRLAGRTDCVLALLTGNMARGAELKLTHYRVWHYFTLGAYADDHHDRNQLGPVALERARRQHRADFTAERTVVIGDTPHDIACARAFGARAVAVATGGFRADALAQHQPDALLEDLSDAERFLALLG